MPRAEVDAALGRAFGAVRASLGAAPETAAAAPDAPARPLADWPGWGPLRRRLRLLERDAAQVALARKAIAEVLGKP
jgi:hypothetical protein